MATDVLIIRGGVKDYSSANRYGKLRDVEFTSKDMRNIPRHLSDSIDIMKNYEEPPYVLLSGNLSLVIPLVLASYEVFGVVKLLIYDVKNRIYSKREITRESVSDYFLM